ncbi:hypothetical protein LINPERPRIM_LOCUS13082 [Linum perenne]
MALLFMRTILQQQVELFKQGHKIDALLANLGACSILRAKLRAVKIGLNRAWNLGAKKVILELDSLAGVLSIQESTTWDSRHGPILQQIQLLRSRDWQVVVQHCYMEANSVARPPFPFGQL